MCIGKYVRATGCHRRSGSVPCEKRYCDTAMVASIYRRVMIRLYDVVCIIVIYVLFFIIIILMKEGTYERPEGVTVDVVGIKSISE